MQKSVLREFSSSLWIATSGRASLREARIILPATWHTGSLSCSFMEPIGETSPATPYHISIRRSHPIFGNKPWAQQTQGCGRPGDFIQMGADILRASSNDTHQHTARLVLSEWGKFRWGVFEEKGHEGDPLYPPFYRDPNSHQWEPTSCLDGKVHSAGPECDPAIPTCRFTPEPYSNGHISSSLLSYPDISSIKKFCDEHNHNRIAPTKHNALCGGRSAWEIIEQNPDFIYGRNPPSNASRALDPAFKIVKEGNAKFVLVIEDTATMNLQRRWEFLRKAVRRVVVYDIPDKSYVSVVSFNSVAKTVAKLTYIESEDSDMRQRVGSALPRNPSSVPESHKCMLCGIQEALRTLDEASTDSNGASLILITSGAGTSTHHQLKEMIHLINEKEVKIMLVLYPITERPGTTSITSIQDLMPLTRAGLGGRSFTVMDEGVGNDSKVSMLMSLMNALLAAVRLSGDADEPGAPILVHRDSYPGGIASMSTGNFALDDSLGPNARFSVYYYDLNHVGNAIQLTTPSGNTMVPLQEEDGDVNMIFVYLEKAERGMWSYTVENRADSHQGLYVQVTAKRNTSSGLNVRLWTSSGSNPVNASDPSNPVIIYAQIQDNRATVLNARVVAVLQRLGTNETGSSYKPIEIELRDNGNGDPDITAGDGVYSRYLPPLHHLAGRYLLTADVDYNNGMALIVKESPTRHHKSSSHYGYFYQQHDSRFSEKECCGSTLAKVHSRRAAPFHHHVTYGVLDVVHPFTHFDITPPSRILDLEVNVNDTVYEVTLKWTAPGDDFDIGRAHHYKGVVAPSWDQAKAFQGDTLSGLPTPLTAGNHQTTTLHFTRYEELWYISLRAVDDAGNVGGIGNIASLWVPRPPTTYEITTRTQPGLTTSGNVTTVSQELGSSRALGISDLRLEDLAVILGSVGGFLFVIFLFALYCICHTRARRKEQQQKDVEKLRGGNSVIVKSGSCQGGLDESVDSLDCDGTKDIDVTQQGTRSLSPVQSWGATTLLQEHERRLSINSSGALVSGLQKDEGLIAYQPEPANGIGSSYPPDVTVTNHQECHTPTSSHGTQGHDPPPYDPPPYTTYAGEEGNSCPCVPGPEYTSYSNAWDEPITGHLLTRSHNGPPIIPSNGNPVDRKRRNVTQV
ncbi:Calcium-activated chloride channel regulator 2 [Armadillidium nasatum]|uniref:Calcium-activated chloride channel regulator 2 n=1 Tax=Armadillidium nasatum TaxID=96803 RepID=A0A5N5TPU8_9CRUS|nr:Calcium-activated chloride channel regulator 2 [Armadillidium nasatum]